MRCAPPDNKPLPEEIARCLDHLDAEVDALPDVRVVVALGKIGFDAWLQLLKTSRRARNAAAAVRSRRGRANGSRDDGTADVLIGCYHPSRQNTNTGKLDARR